MLDHLVPPRSASTFGAVVVSPHSVATTAGLDVLAAGGTAADAAIAVNAVQGVVAPETCGVGGDLFALVHTPGESAPTYLNASGRAGSRASSARLRDGGAEAMPLWGPAAVTVPGCVDGWIALNARYGKLPIADVLAPAIRLATEGFPASTELAGSFARRADELRTQPSAPEIYAGDLPPDRGARVVRPLLAITLQAIAGGGRAAFYDGDFGAALTSVPDIDITPDDLLVDQAEWTSPAGRRIAGLDAWTSPPNTQGHITLAALRIFEMVDGPSDPEDPAFHHLLIEAYRAAAWDRGDVTTDPTTAPLTPEELLDDDRLQARADRIRPDATAVWPAMSDAPPGTAYMCVLDADGMGVSLIQSNYHGIGAGVSAGATGVWLHNRGGGFTLEPGHPNELTPGRRPLHTLAPTIWTDAGRLRMILGTRGGDQQPQLLAQVAAPILYRGATPGDAQAAPRWTTRHLTGTSRLLVERRMSPALLAELGRRGHDVESVDDFVGGNGPVSIITEDGNGLRTGAADPRVDTSQVGIR